MGQLEDFFEYETLEKNYQSLVDGHFCVVKQRPRVAIGSDRVDLELFNRDADKHLRAIQRKVLQGRYTFSAFLERQIPKIDSKEVRTISIASIRDAIVQRGIYRYLYDRVDQRLSDSVFGYRRNRSAHDAIFHLRQQFASGRTHVFDADLTKFFDRLDHATLMEKVDELEDVDERATTLVRRFIKTGKIDAEQVEYHRKQTGKKAKYQPIPRNQGVPQGGVLSGMLSNLYLANFDQKMLESYPGYVRYADDFLVCCESPAECHYVSVDVPQHLPVNAVLNLAKTEECVSASKGIDFLGFRVTTSKLSVRGRNVGKFKRRISTVIETQKQHPSWKSTLASLIYRLRFKIQGPRANQLQALANLGFRVAPYQRSWIGFFRIVDDTEQVRQLDRWIRKQISAYMWNTHQKKITLAVLQEFDMPTLVNTLYRARTAKAMIAVDEASFGMDDELQ